MSLLPEQSWYVLVPDRRVAQAADAMLDEVCRVWQSLGGAPIDVELQVAEYACSQTDASHLSYHEYLASPEWLERRILAHRRAHGRCQTCDTEEQLDVHHRTYENYGREPSWDLTVLCRDCHTAIHESLKARGVRL